MSWLSNIKNSTNNKKVVEQIKQKHAANSFISQAKFDQGLNRASSSLDDIINQIAAKYYKVDENIGEQIEELLISYDVGTAACQKVLTAILDEIKLQKINSPEIIKQIIIDKLLVYYIQDSNVDTNLRITKGTSNVILVAGVNGVGKTTSIAKLTNYFVKQGLKVCLVAGDTFRAGAVAQLEIWAQRLNVPIFKPNTDGQDPASVIYQGVKYGKENHIDIILCDTSGRLQTKVNLMNELKKINDIIKKFDQNQPCESLLVLDATTGQNGVFQAKAFNEVTKLTGIILTKMDSSSKGGIVLAIKDAFNVPIKFIGLGETIDDLLPFDLEMFITSLTKNLHIK
ncbi:MAG: signal recognition particle-docking protein FtsY [Mycoplasmataceae bacterium]|nr:signal recognition particle-docking protein FtsY [Mycoplasmataceae bacterium]